MDIKKESLKLHKDNKGKININSKIPVKTKKDLSLAYSPGVAEPCLEIKEDKLKIYDYTNKGNMVAVVSNGSAVLGLGNIGAEASLPVMEGKSILFKEFADIDAFPICLNSPDTNHFIQTVKALEPTFGGINLEDISAPQCFEIEEKLKREMDIPVFHDDQHGTAIVTLAGLINSLKLVNKDFNDIKIVMNGAGAAGVAIANTLLHMGVKEIIICDRVGAIYEGRESGMNPTKEELASKTNLNKNKGSLKEVVANSDVFIGVSIEGALTKEMVKSMNNDSIIFALANPNPEINPHDAISAGAKVIATGRSDFPNQVNNVLAFPGIFRGVLDVRAKNITNDMKIAASYAIANIISDKELNEEYVIPNPFDKRVVENVRYSVKKIAIETGEARIQ